MTTLLLARHGETDWNRERRWQGHADQPLNEAGRTQARELAETLADRSIDAIYASDLIRAHETARIIAERLGLPVATNELLREVDVGDWAELSDRARILRRSSAAEAAGSAAGDRGAADVVRLERARASTLDVANCEVVELHFSGDRLTPVIG